MRNTKQKNKEIAKTKKLIRSKVKNFKILKREKWKKKKKRKQAKIKKSCAIFIKNKQYS